MGVWTWQPLTTWKRKDDRSSISCSKLGRSGFSFLVVSCCQGMWMTVPALPCGGMPQSTGEGHIFPFLKALACRHLPFPPHSSQTTLLFDWCGGKCAYERCTRTVGTPLPTPLANIVFVRGDQGWRQPTHLHPFLKPKPLALRRGLRGGVAPPLITAFTFRTL